MSLFLDASAIVAMLGREPEAVPFGRRVEWESDRLTSAIAIWEATRGLANARDLAIEEAEAIVADYVRDFRVRVVPIGIEEAELALEAHRRFGKGRHDAKLNLATVSPMPAPCGMTQNCSSRATISFTPT